MSNDRIAKGASLNFQRRFCQRMTPGRANHKDDQ